MSLTLARAASARQGADEVIGAPLRVGLFGGWHATSGDLDVLGDRYEGNAPEPGPMFGLRGGWRFARGWGLDLMVGAVPAGPQWLVPVVAEAKWRPLEGGGLTPTAGLGAGVYAGIGAGGDVDLVMSATLGVELTLGRAAALRVEVGLLASDAVDGALSLSPVVSVGVDVLMWRDAAGREPDGGRLDGPGPARPALPVPKGCPRGAAPERCGDLDGDGIIDAFDRCPVDAGTLGGCADADGDGVPGPRDACPARAGTWTDWGCPR